jgi:hypothetical protein
LVDGDHGADVLLEHVPVLRHGRDEELGVLWRVRQVHLRAQWCDHVAQERLGQHCQQVFLVGVVPVERRRRPAGRRGDLGQCRAVETPLGEQLASGELDGVAGLTTLGGE